MPQIWMTYDEIAELIGSDADAARAQAMHRSLDRRKSRDGLTRVKLDLEWTTRFIAAIREARSGAGPGHPPAARHARCDVPRRPLHWGQLRRRKRTVVSVTTTFHLARRTGAARQEKSRSRPGASRHRRTPRPETRRGGGRPAARP